MACCRLRWIRCARRLRLRLRGACSCSERVDKWRVALVIDLGQNGQPSTVLRMVNLLVKLHHWTSISFKVSLMSLAPQKLDRAAEEMLLRLWCRLFCTLRNDSLAFQPGWALSPRPIVSNRIGAPSTAIHAIPTTIISQSSIANDDVPHIPL